MTARPDRRPPPSRTDPLATARAAVDATLHGYVAALGARDIAGIRRHYPTMTKQREESLQRTFDAFQSHSATMLQVEPATLTGETAEAVMVYRERGKIRGGALIDQTLRVRAKLTRSGSGWQIETLAAIR